jgi:hypothetical protein
MKKYFSRNKLGLLFGALFLIISLQEASAARRGLFVGPQYWRPDAETQRRARESKFTSIFLFTLYVGSDGAISFDGNPIVSANGTWVGGSWKTSIDGCRGGYVNRVELCIGEWGSTAFDNIKNLVNAGSPALRRNFTTLRNNMNLDAIQIDDEKTYDRHSMVALCKMLTEVGFPKVTLAPYNNQSFWVNVKADLGSRVGAVYLQCYDGGAGNVPSNWRTAMGGTSVLYPGETIFSGGTAVTERMKTWRLLGFPGGFIWGDKRLPSSEWGQWLIDAGF